MKVTRSFVFIKATRISAQIIYKIIFCGALMHPNYPNEIARKQIKYPGHSDVDSGNSCRLAG